MLDDVTELQSSCCVWVWGLEDDIDVGQAEVWLNVTVHKELCLKYMLVLYNSFLD